MKKKLIKKKVRKLNKIKLLLVGLIFVLIFAGFAIADVIIDNRFEQRVIDGRTLIDEYRIQHDLQYVKGIKVRDYESELFNTLTLELEKIGYREEFFDDKVNSFFSDSDLYNIQVLGYSDKEELELSASVDDKETYLTMWK